MKGKVAFHSLGCRVNIYETRIMQTCMRNAGYEEVPFAPGADIYVINTCTVTNIADRKSRQMLHRAREMNPDAVVVAVGCYVEDAGEALRIDPAVDVVVGNGEKGRLPEILEAYFAEIRRLEGKERKRAFACGNVRINAVQEYEEAPFHAESGHTRAFLKIQDGCNQFCSYCMIPYVRGRVRSRKLSDILKEAKTLAGLGYREIVLTGIHLSSYGLDFEMPGRNLRTPFAKEARTNGRLLEVLRAVASVPGIMRLRMGSLEPGIITEEFAKALAGIPAFCPSFHLSLQSGCDETLLRMRRRYTTGDYARICGILRKVFPDASIATDIIAGFPGETEEEFQKTLSFVSEIHFARTHIFKYSVRRGTAAAGMPGQVPDKVKTERAKKLLAIDQKERAAFARRFLGREMEVLLEEYHGGGEDGYFTGYTREYVPVRLSCPDGIPGELRSFTPMAERDGELMAL